jgi:hypothetical protein
MKHRTRIYFSAEQRADILLEMECDDETQNPHLL